MTATNKGARRVACQTLNNKTTRPTDTKIKRTVSDSSQTFLGIKDSGEDAEIIALGLSVVATFEWGRQQRLRASASATGIWTGRCDMVWRVRGLPVWYVGIGPFIIEVDDCLRWKGGEEIR